MDFLDRLAASISRKPHETAALASAPGTRGKLALFTALGLALPLIYGPALTSEYVKWREFRPDVPVSSQEIAVVYDGPEDACAFDAPAGADCLASPRNPALWSSPYRRGDAEHGDRMIDSAEAPVTWFGWTIPATRLREAARIGANQLLLGWFQASARVWVDGRPLLESAGHLSMEPLTVTLPMDRLSTGEPLRVAIALSHDSSLITSDLFDEGRGGEGFLTATSAEAYRTLMSFTLATRPFALVMAYLLLAMLFFAFWLPTKLKQEYFYMAVFALVSASSAAVSARATGMHFHLETLARLQLFVGACFAFFGMFLGFAFARVRLDVFRWGVPSALALAVTAAVAVPAWLVDRWVALTHAALAPVCFLLGAVACGLQSLELTRRGRRGAYVPVRARRLAVFGAALACYGLYAAIRPEVPFIFDVLWTGAAHLGLMLFLAFIALQEYGAQEALISRTPISDYHRRPVLPERVRGAVFVADLKDSEALFRAGASAGDAGRFAEACLSHMWGAVIEQNGVVLQTEGDALRAFFDADRCPEPVAAALAAADEMARRLAGLEEQFRAHGLAIRSLDFRAGVALGEIRPVWQEMGRNRFAAWAEAGNSNPFVESARLMELERQIEGLPQKTVTVLPEELAPADPGRFALRDRALSGKHGKTYRVAAYLPRKSPSRDAAAAA